MYLQTEKAFMISGHYKKERNSFFYIQELRYLFGILPAV
jgi:hypothetical protein